MGIVTARWLILSALMCAAACAGQGSGGKPPGASEPEGEDPKADGATPAPPKPALDAAAPAPSDGGRSEEPPPDVAPPVDSTGPADAPPIATAQDAGVAGDAATPAAGMRLSLREDLAARWTGERKSTTMEDGIQVFTGVFEPGRIGGPSGHTAKLPISPGRDYLFEYRVRFDTGFDWSRGGKMPGLAGATAPTGCVTVTGTGFTARMMWHGGGRLTGYTYALDQNTGCGNSIETGFNFAVGRWYNIKERVKLNTGSNKNGVLQLWVDDRMVIDRSNIPWMNESPTRRIDLVYIQTFFGGSTLDWAPSRRCSISFAEPFVTKLAD
jgi:hypothetical protein